MAPKRDWNGNAKNQGFERQQQQQQQQNKNCKRQKYIYGNYDHYYGYRVGKTEDDPRVGFFRKEWIEKKDCLDIGCNEGHVTIGVAVRYGCKSMLGVDIDSKLIGKARNNLRFEKDALRAARRAAKESGSNAEGDPSKVKDGGLDPPTKPADEEVIEAAVEDPQEEVIEAAVDDPLEEVIQAAVDNPQEEVVQAAVEDAQEAVAECAQEVIQAAVEDAQEMLLAAATENDDQEMIEAGDNDCQEVIRAAVAAENASPGMNETTNGVRETAGVQEPKAVPGLAAQDEELTIDPELQDPRPTAQHSKVVKIDIEVYLSVQHSKDEQVLKIDPEGQDSRLAEAQLAAQHLKDEQELKMDPEVQLAAQHFEDEREVKMDPEVQLAAQHLKDEKVAPEVQLTAQHLKDEQELRIDPELQVTAQHSKDEQIEVQDPGLQHEQECKKENVDHEGPKKENLEPGVQEMSYREHNALLERISFRTQNYLEGRDEKGKYDTIFCLSVSKWIHLNWGDEGLTTFFSKIFRELRPGGVLVLEPQPWSSYSKKRKVSKVASAHYREAVLRPEHFPSLLTEKIGFQSYEEITAHLPNDKTGFQRPLFAYFKGGRD